MVGAVCEDVNELEEWEEQLPSWNRRGVAPPTPPIHSHLHRPRQPFAQHSYSWTSFKQYTGTEGASGNSAYFGKRWDCPLIFQSPRNDFCLGCKAGARPLVVANQHT